MLANFFVSYESHTNGRSTVYKKFQPSVHATTYYSSCPRPYTEGQTKGKQDWSNSLLVRRIQSTGGTDIKQECYPKRQPPTLLNATNKMDRKLQEVSGRSE